MNKALLSSKKMDWRTPADFFRELDLEFHCSRGQRKNQSADVRNMDGGGADAP